MARAVQAMKDNYQVLDAVLVLAIAFVPPTAQTPTLALPAPDSHPLPTQ